LSEINELRNDVLLGEQRFSNKLSEKKEKKEKNESLTANHGSQPVSGHLEK